jgi:hypothetical protein
MPTFHYPARSLNGTRQRGDYVLGQVGNALMIGVRFGNEWRPARTAGPSDIRFFK